MDKTQELVGFTTAGGLFEHISGKYGVAWDGVELPEEYQFRDKAMAALGRLRADAILAALENRPTAAGELIGWKQGDQALLAEMADDQRLTAEQRVMCRRLAALESRPAPTEERMQAYELVIEYIAYLLSALQPFANAAETADDRNAINDPKGEARAMPWNFVNSTHFAEAFGAYTERLDPDDLEVLRPVATPSRDEEGSVDREAIARIIAAMDAVNVTAGQSFRFRNNEMGWIVPDDEMQDLRDAILALNTSTPETQTVEGGEQEIARLRREIINAPETADFMAGVPIEAAHQRERWGASHDAGKTPFDWFWLLGYLTQKAAEAAVRGDAEKARHHTISSASALANWNAALNGEDTSMSPRIYPVERNVA